MLSSDLHGHQASKWYTNIHIEFKKKNVRRCWDCQSSVKYVCEGVFPVISALGVEKGSWASLVS